MRALFFVLPVIVIMLVLAACTTTAADDADDTVAEDPTETPVMDEQQVDDADDAVVDDDDDAVVDDADDAVVDDDDDAVDDDDEVDEPTEHIIELVDGNEFSPDEITISPGDTVTWVNTTDQVHTASADPDIANDPDYVSLPEGAEPWHSGNIEPGEEYSITLDVPGEYTYFCYPHQDAGMIGMIIVEDPESVETDDDAPVDDAVDDTEVDDDYDDADDAVAPEEDDDYVVTEEPTYTGKDATN